MDVESVVARGRGEAAVAAARRSAPILRTGEEIDGAQRPVRAVREARHGLAIARDRAIAVHGDARRRARVVRAAEDCGAAGRPPLRCVSSATIRRAASRWWCGRVDSVLTSPTARPTPRCARATASRRSPSSAAPSCSPSAARAAAAKKSTARRAPAKKTAGQEDRQKDRRKEEAREEVRGQETVRANPQATGRRLPLAVARRCSLTFSVEANVSGLTRAVLGHLRWPRRVTGQIKARKAAAPPLVVAGLAFDLTVVPLDTVFATSRARGAGHPATTPAVSQRGARARPRRGGRRATAGERGAQRPRDQVVPPAVDLAVAVESRRLAGLPRHDVAGRAS